MEFLAPGFHLAQISCHGHQVGSQPVDRTTPPPSCALCVYVCVCMTLFFR